MITGATLFILTSLLALDNSKDNCYFSSHKLSSYIVTHHNGIQLDQDTTISFNIHLQNLDTSGPDNFEFVRSECLDSAEVYIVTTTNCHGLQKLNLIICFSTNAYVYKVLMNDNQIEYSYKIHWDPTTSFDDIIRANIISDSRIFIGETRVSQICEYGNVKFSYYQYGSTAVEDIFDRLVGYKY